MRKEEQITLICSVIQKQRRKNPHASELEILANTKLICKMLVESEDIEQEILEGTLALIFTVEKERLKNKEEAKKKVAEKAEAKRIAEEKRKKETVSYDPCSPSSYRSVSRGGC